MELYQLRGFLAVSETGNLTRAAEKLHVSQPALSAQIRALEEAFGLVLFERRAGGMMLTTAGKRLLPEAERVLAAAARLRNEARILKGEVVGRARIGTLYDPAFIRLGALLSAVVERYPLLEVELQQAVSGAALQQVGSSLLDASFFYGELDQDDVCGLALLNFNFRVAAPAGWHELIQIADWSDIAAQPWIIPPPISSHHRLAHRLFEQHGVEPVRVIESDNDAIVASLVASGVGMALLREDVANAKAAAGEVCVWGKTRVPTTLWFIHRRERSHDPVIVALLDTLKDVWNLRRDAKTVSSHQGTAG